MVEALTEKCETFATKIETDQLSYEFNKYVTNSEFGDFLVDFKEYKSKQINFKDFEDIKASNEFISKKIPELASKDEIKKELREISKELI